MKINSRYSSSNKIVAISNTGPLISAFQCSGTEILKHYFSVIYITVSEIVELSKHGWAKEIDEMINGGLVKVIEQLTEQEKREAEQIAKSIASESTSGDPDWHNHLPEAEAISLMQHRRHLMIDIMLIDEKAARKVAQKLKLEFTGFPGITGRAGMDGLISQDMIRQMLRLCQKKGTHYSDELIETIAQTYGR